EVSELAGPRRVRRARLRGAQLEQVLPPGAALDDQVAASVERAPRAEELAGVCRLVPGRAAALERRAARPDGVDLVDEDDALAAPLRCEPARLAREPADDD